MKKYRGVSLEKYNKKNLKEIWVAKITIKGKVIQQVCASEREAAIAYDKMRLKHGLKPKNILKPMTGKGDT